MIQRGPHTRISQTTVFEIRMPRVGHRAFRRNLSDGTASQKDRMHRRMQAPAKRHRKALRKVFLQPTCGLRKDLQNKRTASRHTQKPVQRPLRDPLKVSTSITADYPTDLRKTFSDVSRPTRRNDAHHMSRLRFAAPCRMLSHPPNDRQACPRALLTEDERRLCPSVRYSFLFFI